MLRLHLFFFSSDRVFAGISDVNNSSPWYMGIPRLKFPRAAPSRSTLKLEEAWLVFLSEEQRKKLLRPGLRAVDLGAAPGGWSYQLVNRGMRVTAVDNGPMAATIMQSGLVTHLHEDGFAFRPSKPVDWMVCDIVEQPGRIAKLAGQWIANRWCRHVIFNLKLPMKKRYEEVLRCKGIIEKECRGANSRYSLRIKQLYHDREEVTGYLTGS
jgi:23S rRNA (cytidine2498-2'-O)-methyltransferase